MNRYFRLRSVGRATVLGVVLAGSSLASAQGTYTPAPENLKARAWFQDAKFGLFIHWGVYCVLGDGEWVMETRPVNRPGYRKLPNFFNPTKFDPAAWVELAKTAGCARCPAALLRA